MHQISATNFLSYHGLPFLVGLSLVKSVLQQDLAKDDKIKELEAEIEELMAQLDDDDDSPAALPAPRREGGGAKGKW